MLLQQAEVQKKRRLQPMAFLGTLLILIAFFQILQSNQKPDLQPLEYNITYLETNETHSQGTQPFTEEGEFTPKDAIPTKFGLILNQSDKPRIVDFWGYVNVPEKTDVHMVVSARDCLKELRINNFVVLKEDKCTPDEQDITCMHCNGVEIDLNEILGTGLNKIDGELYAKNGQAYFRIYEKTHITQRNLYGIWIFLLTTLGCIVLIAILRKRDAKSNIILAVVSILYIFTLTAGWTTLPGFTTSMLTLPVLITVAVFLILFIPSDFERKPKLFLISALIVIVAYTTPIFLRWDYNFGGDGDHFSAFYQAAKNAIINYHQIPFWNPYACGGTVLLAMPESAFVTPLFVNMLLFDVVHAIKICCVA